MKHFFSFRYLLLLLLSLALLLKLANASSVGEQPQFDGPAELPRVYVRSAMSDTPAPGRVLRLKASDDFQDALTRSSCGDIIELEAGATYRGKYKIPMKHCDDSHWIIVRTSAYSELPPEGTRITPCFAGVESLPGRPYRCTLTRNVMSRVVLPQRGDSGPLEIEDGANHYRFVGLEITREPGSTVYNLIVPQKGGVSDHLVFDHVWVHGGEQDETNRGIMLTGTSQVAIIDSFFSDFKCIAITGACVDSQAIGGGLGDHPMSAVKIVNNFLEASGQSICFGGGPATISPSDIEIRHNYLFKPLLWKPETPHFVGALDGHPFIVKNIFELKSAQRVLFEGNVLENVWGGFSQTGFGVLLTPKNQGANQCPSCQVTDVTIRFCKISHVGSGFQIANGLSDNGAIPKAGLRYSIHDVVVDDILGEALQGFGILAQISTAARPNVNAPLIQDVKLDHLTGFPPSGLFVIGGPVALKMDRLSFTNSIVTAPQRGIASTGGGPQINCAALPERRGPAGVLSTCFAHFEVRDNVIVAGGKDWPTGNFLPKKLSDVGFVNINDKDYHLAASSRFKRAASDGRDLGADIDAVEASTAGVK